MRFSQPASISKRWKERKFGNSRAKKKHKRLDAICENVYKRNHSAVKAESEDCNVRGVYLENQSEVRRSSRVRRAPVVLDASPLPAKKRRKIDKRIGVASVERVKREDWANSDSPCSSARNVEEQPGSWRSRLRSRANNVSFGGREKENFLRRGKRKLFQELDGVKEESNLRVGQLDEEKDGVEGGKFTVVKSKRPGRIKASNVSRNEHLEIEPDCIEENGKENSARKALQVNDNEDDSLHLSKKVECGMDGLIEDCNAAISIVEKEESDVQGILPVEDCAGDDNVEPVELAGQMGQPECLMEEEIQKGNVEDGGVQEIQKGNVEDGEVPSNQAEDGGHDRALEDEISKEENKIAVENSEEENKIADENSKEENKIARASSDPWYKPRIKEGRRCGLCGGGTDGKPPKRLVHDGAGSDNEGYSGSSASDEPNYDIWDGFGDEPGWLGRLLGPINDRYGIAGIWVHQHCAVWSPEVYFAGLGCLKNVRAALCRGRVLKCSRCGRPGATIGCRVDRCPKTYHLPCARAEGCIFDHRKFLIACTDHRHLFQPHGGRYIHLAKKMKARKMKLEIKKSSNDARRKDVEAEEKWLENCGEDEEFLKRESKRLHRDLLRVAPVYIGGSNFEQEMQFQGWESVAGLQEVIQCMKEVVILPLLYPEFFSNMGLTPPRGVLLHGYPGTGKTLVVRALIGSCARGDKRIAYFARKGADCLGKYVGDAERQLRLLFQVAEKSQPSIIFFDEIDGLAPSRSRQQDQTHNSVVSTLLALLDGLKSRGSVVVIGATNRPDAVDPALRRPGRFDREIYFPLPSVKDREAILSVHTQKWPKPVTGSLLKWIARKTVGFAGADLQGLCTQAAIIALKRSCPLKEIMSAAEEKATQSKRHPLPNFTVEERDWVEAISRAPAPCSRREAGMAANDVVSSPLQVHLLPCLLQPIARLLISLYLDERIWLPPPIIKAVTLIKNVIVSALDKKKVPSEYWWSHVHGLLQESNIACKIERKLLQTSILVGDSSFNGVGVLEDDTDENGLRFDASEVQHRVTRASLLQNASYESKKKLGFRTLISGSPNSGVRHLASCLLHSFIGNVKIQKIDLATISLEGHGDVVQGVTRILLGCASVGTCMIFMPRIDLWAVETCYQVDEKEIDSPLPDLDLADVKNSISPHNEEVDKENMSCLEVCKPGEATGARDASQMASYLWSSFVEQVESMCPSTSLIILATSELPFSKLPLRIRQFFNTGTTNCSLSTPLEETVPRFSVNVDGNVDFDVVIDSSASKLSKDLAQQFVQLIHFKNHLHIGRQMEHIACGDYKDSTIEHGSKEESSVSPVVNVQPTLNIKNVKGKSSLLLATSTFGYQILCYPHFAELCWVTSKLKEGPFADVNGPWKGWPFNSCIIRPNDSLKSVALTSSSSNTRCKEKSGIVRGLIAVGLSAYRGEYTSLKEVSSNVRRVLEHLAERVNAKIQAGKDRYQFTRLLSQVAYLEDTVNSWAYTLQSLDVDAHLTDANPNLPSEGSLDKCKASHDNNIIQADECKPNTLNKSLHEPQLLEESTLAFDTEGRLVAVNGDLRNESDVRDLKCSEHSNGFALTDSADIAKDGPCFDGEMGCANHENVPLEEDNSDQSTSIICSYQFCPQCFLNLHHLMRKILLHQQKLKGNNWTVEEFHDVITSLSVNLYSVVLKLCPRENSSNSYDQDLIRDAYTKLFGDEEHMETCQSRSSQRKLAMSMECVCHSRQESVTAKVNSLQKLIFRDGVLMPPVDPEEDVSFHCKFKKLCLCSLIEWIVLTKQQPLD